MKKPKKPSTETYTDEDGNTVTICPPGYALGAVPDRAAKPSGKPQKTA